MYRSISSTGKLFRLGQCCFAVVIVACLGLSGCANLDLCGGGLCGNGADSSSPGADGYDMDGWSEGLRRSTAQGEFFGVSNEARQIEENCSR